jgi:sugar phosphate isomerase/epimerase
MKNVELMNLYWSSAGLFPGDGAFSPFELSARAQSAAKAGFGGLSFWHTDLDHLLETRSLKEVRAILDDNGVGVFEVEFIEDWFLDGPARDASNNRKQMLLEASAVLGAHHVKVGDFRNTPVGMPRLIDSFATLCEDAAEFGATIGFEFMASAMIHTLEESLAMVEGAGAKNGGLIVDIAHTMALGISNEAVSKIPGRYMISVELNDNLLPTTPGYEPGARKFCGEGEFDIAGFVAAVKATGYAGPWAIEVFNRELDGWPLEKLDAKSYETALPFVAG